MADRPSSDARRFRGPFAAWRYVRWAQRQAELAQIQRMMDENNARLADIRERRRCRACEASPHA